VLSAREEHELQGLGTKALGKISESKRNAVRKQGSLVGNIHWEDRDGDGRVTLGCSFGRYVVRWNEVAQDRVQRRGLVVF
jgi:hypothetical protein